MKYMGSKKSMLDNGLGKMLKRVVPRFERFVDLFSGSGTVSWFVAQKTNVPVLAADLQLYSSILAESVIGRDKTLNAERLIKSWIDPSLSEAELLADKLGIEKDLSKKFFKKTVLASRVICSENPDIGPIWRAYGGHYYSPLQALQIDTLLKNLPEKGIENTACHAALIDTGSRLAAAPGHTAQPFQPTSTALPFLEGAWKRPIKEVIESSLKDICGRRANKIGTAVQSDANVLASSLNSRDLVFIDPPYSGVQYSRFYHVLETIAKKDCGEVTGVGRYPDQVERPKSDYSNTGTSLAAIKSLLENLAKKKSSIILTFPVNKCSNGLSGKQIMKLAEEYYTISEKLIKGSFSTLGGNNKKRKSRKKSRELVLYMRPRNTKKSLPI